MNDDSALQLKVRSAISGIALSEALCHVLTDGDATTVCLVLDHQDNCLTCYTNIKVFQDMVDTLKVITDLIPRIVEVGVDITDLVNLPEREKDS